MKRFLKDSGTLLSGNLVAQGAAFAAYLLLARLFTPEDFGLYTIFYSYIEVLIILSTCKYELSLVVAESDAEAVRLARATLRLNAVVSVALLAVALVLELTPLGSRSSLALLHHPWCVMLVPPMVFFCGTTRVYTFLCNRHKRYSAIASSEVVTSMGGIASKTLFGLGASALTLLHAIGLPLGTVAGKMAGNLYFRRACRDLMEAHPRQSGAAAAPLLRKHRNFPLYVMPKDFVCSLSANLPFLWLAAYFDEASLGLFSLAVTFTLRPVNLINCAFERVFYADTAQRVRERQPILPDIRRFLLLLNAVAFPLAAIGFWCCEPLFTFLFGQRWVGTGFYVRCLIPWILVMLSANSLMFVSNIFGTQRAEFLFQLALLVLRVAALGAGIAAGDFRLAVLLFSAASTLVLCALLWWYLLQVLRYERSLSH